MNLGAHVTRRNLTHWRPIMAEQQKKDASKAVPRDLPMPRYDYQKPSTGTYTVRYDEQKERDRQAGREKAPSLQNLKLAI
jgi:hypothetical protein